MEIRQRIRCNENGLRKLWAQPGQHGWRKYPPVFNAHHDESTLSPDDVISGRHVTIQPEESVEQVCYEVPMFGED